MNYIQQTHRDSSITTVRNFLTPSGEVGITKGWSIYGFLNFKGDTTLTNLDRIWRSYTKEEKKSNESIYQSLQTNPSEANYEASGGDLYLKIGVNLFLDLQYLNREILITESNQLVEQESYRDFWVEALRKLLWDERYRKVTSQTLQKLGTVQNIFPQYTVWLWSRKLSSASSNSMDGQIFNLTPFLQNVSCSVTNQGGNFELTLPPIVGRYNGDVWEIDSDFLKSMKATDFQYAASSTLHGNNKDFLRQNFFFEKIISANDIIFIRFETLELELQDRVRNIKDLYIDKSELPNKTYDMIGLVDSCSRSARSTREATIKVTGRDCMKLLIEDGVYFYPSDFVNGFFGNQQDEEGIERLDGRIIMLTQDLVKSIGYSLKFVINGLSTISICPDNLLDGYAKSYDGSMKDVSSINANNIGQVVELKPTDRRSKKFVLKTNKQEIENLSSQQRNELDTLKKKALSEIKALQIQNNKEVDETPVFNELVDFLQGLNEENKIDRQNDKLLGWEGEKGQKNIIPSSLYTQLYKTGTIIYYDVKDKARLGALKEQNSILKSHLKSQQGKLNEMKSRSTLNNPYKKSKASLQKQYDKEVEVAIETTDKFIKDNPESGFKLDYEAISKSVPIYEEYEQVKDQYDQWDLETSISTGGYTENEIFVQQDLVNKLKRDIRENEAKMKKLQKITYKTSRYSELSPTDKVVFQTVFDFILKRSQSFSEALTKVEEKPMRGIWQIIKLVVDENIESRRLVDNTLGNEMGSLINAIRKVCQEPFVEFFGDTYYDQYYFVARKCPTDYSAYNQLREKAIDVYDFDVISEDFDFEAGEVYSWFRLTPQSLIDGLASESIRSYIKAIRFPEYAQIWGEKALDIVSNYLDYQPTLGANQKVPEAYLVKRAIADLKFVIESHAYKPFTRRGTLSINGNRTIKRGTCIRYMPTGEIFYVDSVNNSGMISGTAVDRVTTLELSRGMVDTCFEKYFNIINLQYDDNLFYREGVGYADWVQKVFSNWTVNQSVFNFFLRNMQFVKEQSSPDPFDYQRRLIEQGKI